MAEETERRRRRWTWEREFPNYDVMGNGYDEMSESQQLLVAKDRQRFDRITKKVTAAVREGRFEDALVLADNYDREDLLNEWFNEGIMTPADMRTTILLAWDHGPIQRRLDDWEWVEMFEFAGFVASPPQTRPDTPLEVWRGQPGLVGAEVGMSWTTNRAMAEGFAKRWEAQDVPSVVLHTIAPPDAILALDNDRTEDEVIVDPERLEGVTYVEDEVV